MKIEIISPLVVRPAGDGRHWILDEAFVIQVDNDVHAIPTGFKTDMASVPRLFWMFIPRYGRYGPAAVLHDFLYRTAEKDRKYADKVFLEMMKQNNTKRWRRTVMYWAVRIFAKGNYR